MPEPKTDPTLRLERSHNFGNGDVVGVLRWADHIIVWLDRVPPDAWAALEAALAENAGLREALEAARVDRDRLRHGVDRVLARHAQLGTLCEADIFDLERYAQPSNPGETS